MKSSLINAYSAIIHAQLPSGGVSRLDFNTMYERAMDSVSRLHGCIGLSEHLLVTFSISWGVEIPCINMSDLVPFRSGQIKKILYLLVLGQV